MTSSTPHGHPTSTDVARLSGVSRATVSYVLNNDSRQTISAATRRRVLDAANTLGYVANAPASALRRGHSRIVVVALDPLNGGYVGERITSGVRDRLAREGFIVLAHSDEDPGALQEVAAEIRPVGVIALRFLASDIRRGLERAGVRRLLSPEMVVGPDRAPERPWELPVGRLQVEHLVARGYDRLVYALPAHSERLPIALSRLEGARLACAERGIGAPVVVELPLERDEIARELRALSREPGRSAVCAYDDDIAIGILGAMHDLGWTVGRDLAVIGCDDIPAAALVTPALTTVAGDATGIGVAAAQAFLALTDTAPVTAWTPDLLDYRVVVRDSA